MSLCRAKHHRWRKERKKTSCKKFNILLRNQQKPSLPHRGCIVHDPLVAIRRERRGDKHTKWGRHNTVWQDNGRERAPSLRMQPRCDGVLPLDAVKSIATVKLSCVLVGDWARQHLLETEMQGLSQRLQMGAHSQLFFHEWDGEKNNNSSAARCCRLWSGRQGIKHAGESIVF